ncbi:MAG: tetratricopeptide repeat protein [Bacteroidota bacterium]|jgi:tetratricopeptide (TPR) repeat protein|nr:tetratricopeptide repeat protein [Bacteroidota bacterium]
MKKVFNLILLFSFMANSFVHGQDRSADSLEKVMNTSTVDTFKVDLLNKLFMIYEYSDDKKAAAFLKQAIDIAERSQYTNGLGTAYKFAGYYAEDKGNYPEALKFYFNSLKAKEEAGSKPGIADANLCIGNIYYNQENYPEALKKFLIALNIYKELNIKTSIAIAYNNIGGIYFHQESYEKALEMYSKALDMHLESGDKRQLANSYGNIGNVYGNQQKYQQALEMYFKALAIMQEIGNQPAIAGLNSNIGISYTKLGEYEKAKKYLSEARDISLSIGYKSCLSSTYDGLSDLDSATGNFKSAFENHKLHILYNDSLNNEETREKTLQSQLNYEFEKKEAIAAAEHHKELEKQHLLAEEKSSKQKTILLMISFFLLIVVLFAGLIFRSLKTTKKQKTIIEAQKELVEAKQKEMLDSIHYARRIQSSLLPTETYISKSLKRLKKT